MEENNNIPEESNPVTAKNKFFLFERKHQLITLFGLVILLGGFILIVNQIRYAQKFSSSAQTPITYPSIPTPTSAASSGATLTPATRTPTPTTFNAASTPSATIKVIYPNGEETLYKEKEYSIKWSFSTNQKNITYPLETKILLQSASLDKRTRVLTILKKSSYTKEGTNSFTWTVPSTVTTGSNYRIFVQIEKLFPAGQKYTFPKDESDNDFKIRDSKTSGDLKDNLSKNTSENKTGFLKPLKNFFPRIITFFSKLF